MEKKRNLISFFVGLLLISTLYTGCIDSENKTDSYPLSSFDSIKIQFRVNGSFQKTFSEDNITFLDQDNWGHEFFSYSISTLDGSIEHQWNERKYTSSWNYYLKNFTKREGNMTLSFDEDETTITALHAFETLVDENGKTWSFEITAQYIPKNQNVSTEEYKLFSIGKQQTCSKIIDLNFSEIVPSYHPDNISGSRRLIEYECGENSSLTVTVFRSD